MKKGGKEAAAGGRCSVLSEDERSQEALPVPVVANNGPAGDEEQSEEVRSGGHSEPEAVVGIPQDEEAPAAQQSTQDPLALALADESGFIPLTTSRRPSMPGAYPVYGPGHHPQQQQSAEHGYSPTPTATLSSPEESGGDQQPSTDSPSDADDQGEITMEATAEAWRVDEEAEIAERAALQRLQDELQRVRMENELLRRESQSPFTAVATASSVTVPSSVQAASSVQAVGAQIIQPTTTTTDDRTADRQQLPKLDVSRFTCHRHRWLCIAAAVVFALCAAAVAAGVAVGAAKKKNEGQSSLEDPSSRDFPPLVALRTPSMSESSSEFLSRFIDALMDISSGGGYVRAVSSADGTIVAIPHVTIWEGVVHVLQYDPGTDSWAPLRQELEGGENDGLFGQWVDLSSDGTVLAVSMPWSDPSGLADAGSVRVFRMEDDEWVQMGHDIEGDMEAAGEGSTTSLSADGRMIAVASPGAGYGANNQGNQGRARVFRFDDSVGGVNNGVWRQVGDDVFGDGAESNLSFVALSADGRTLALGAFFDDGNGKDSGLVKVLELDEAEEWVQMGSSIRGEAAGDLTGGYPVLSKNGKTLAFSSNGNRGHVRVYRFDDNDWHQLGMDIDGIASVFLSADGSAIIHHHFYPVASVFRFDGLSWQEEIQFVSGQFFPIAFADDNGTEIVGIAQSIDGDGPTLGFYQMD